ncbi:MAG: hypothetical protein HY023_03130 [Chloroflexi bacterium]|nr:hypothetical protein [Chloroflexota bacterium]MBI3762732.1 hypothetical protein [Chloroflexota bacterium]
MTEEFVAPDMLVPDELAPHVLTPWVSWKLHTLVESRWRSDRPLIVTSNYTLDELAYHRRHAAGDGLSEGTLDRLLTATLVLPFEAESYRGRIKAQKLAAIAERRASPGALPAKSRSG